MSSIQNISEDKRGISNEKPIKKSFSKLEGFEKAFIHPPSNNLLWLY